MLGVLNFSPDHNGSLAGQLKEGEKQSGFIAQLSRSINLKQNCKGEECEKSGYKRKQELKKAHALQSIHAILQNSATATGKVVGPGAPEPVIENRHLPTKCTDCSQEKDSESTTESKDDQRPREECLSDGDCGNSDLICTDGKCVTGNTIKECNNNADCGH